MKNTLIINPGLKSGAGTMAYAARHEKISFPALHRLVILLVSVLLSWDTAPAQSLLTYHDRPVKTKKDWSLKRLQILDSMQAGMGKLPTRDARQTPPVQFIDSVSEKNYKRFTIKILVADSENITAYLYVPAGKPKKHPAMLALHETDPIGKQSVDGQGKNKNLAYARELAERGYVVIAPDYPSFGDSKDYDFAADRYESATMKGIFNHIRCVDFLISRKDVDAGKIGVIGHSLGGHNAIFVGALDSRLQVVVASCGWTLFDFYNIGPASEKYGGRLGPWAQDRYMPLFRTKYNLDPQKIPFDFDQVIAAIAPRAFFSNSPMSDTNFDVKGVKKGMEEASAVYRLLGATNQLQARYPHSGHDFPEQVRFDAYQFIDTILKK
jgi:pimeloyl-ACP methyl ester carboxylesterase